MGHLQDEILKKEKEIEGHRSDLTALYADLGKTIAQREAEGPIGYCRPEYDTYRIVESRCEEAEQAFGRLKQFVSQLEDRSRKIQQIEADIKALRAPFEQLYSQLGAVAYESYCASTLPKGPLEVCAPFFEDHFRRTVSLEKALSEARGKAVPGRMKRRVAERILEMRLARQRRQVLPRFVEAGEALVEHGCPQEVPGRGIGSLLEKIGRMQERRQELDEELSIHRTAVAKLKDQEVDSPHRRLEQSKAKYVSCRNELDKAASVYGKALYETLPRDVPPDLVGSAAYALLGQIALHWRRIGKLEADILQLQKMIEVEELEAQITLDKQKIEHLNEQIENANKQINQIRLVIEAKREQIASLLPEQSMEYDGQ